MKILLITNLYPNKHDPNWGVFNYQQFQAMADSCQIFAIVPIPWNTLRTWKIFWSTLLNQVWGGLERLAYKDYPNVFHPVYFNFPLIRRFNGILYYFSIYSRGKKLIKEEKPEKIMATWVFPDGYAAIKLGKKYNLPVYLKVHGSDIHSVEGAYRERKTAQTLTACEKIICVSHALSNAMQKNFNIKKEKINVIPNGIYKDKFVHINRKDALEYIGIQDTHKKNIVFVGNLKPVKNLMMLVEAFDCLHKQSHESIGLHILGAGILYEDLQAYINKNQLEDNVYLHGRVLHEKIPYWMNYADLFVLPSLNEGMPNVVLEALSCGTPVVASNIEATREIINDGINGYLFDLNRLDDFVAKLAQGLKLKTSPAFDRNHDMIISWQENAQRLYQIIAD